MRTALVLLLTAVVLAAAVPGAVAGRDAAQTSVSFAFGRTGGNIAPFTVSIAEDGSVTAKGPVHSSRSRLTQRKLAQLARVVMSEHFFSLRRQIVCPGTLPDFAFSFVTVRSVGGARTVLVRGACSAAFNAVYAALAAAVGIR